MNATTSPATGSNRQSGGLQNKTQFTDAPYVRSHGRSPRGRGMWAFQATSMHTAYDSELMGEILWFKGTLAEARKQLVAAGHHGLFAMLP